MKIHLVSTHQYPARRGAVAAARVSDWLAKGLVEPGHDVSYELPYASADPLPAGVQLTQERRFDVDVMWFNGLPAGRFPQTHGVPWLRALHSAEKRFAPFIRDNWVFVSASHAALFGQQRYVHNGIDPAELLYREAKDGYFLFIVADLLQLEAKGFKIVRELVRRFGIHVVVAGAISDPAPYERMFAEEGMGYVGHVSGHTKAELLAGARALLFPTQADETFGLVVAETLMLMSGTPVICSDRGACQELVPPEFGFVCSNFDEYAVALRQTHTISPLACRIFALEHYHYLRMAWDYLVEFKREVVRGGSPAYRATLGQCSRWVSSELRGRRFAVGIPDRKHFQAV